MDNRTVKLRLSQREVHLVYMALSLARNSPRLGDEYDFDGVIETIADEF